MGDTRRDEIVRDTLNLPGVRDFASYTRDTWSGPNAQPPRPAFDEAAVAGAMIQMVDDYNRDLNAWGYPTMGEQSEIETKVNVDPGGEEYTSILIPGPFGPDRIRAVQALIRALQATPPFVARPRPEPEPETEAERSERLLHEAVLRYAQDGLKHALEICSRRTSSGMPFASTPEESRLLMVQDARLRDRLMEETKGLGYPPAQIHHFAAEAEREVSTAIVQEAKPYIPDPTQAVRALYTNHRGETAMRHFVPAGIWWGMTEQHPSEQWLMDCWDLDKEAVRTYALGGFPGFVISEPEEAT
jgi:hypothetical protein